MDEDDLSDIFAQFFGGGADGPGRGGFRQAVHARGQDMRYHLEVDFLDAARGTRRTVTLPDGHTLDLATPPGLKDGQTLRLRGKGGAGWARARPAMRWSPSRCARTRSLPGRATISRWSCRSPSTRRCSARRSRCHGVGAGFSHHSQGRLFGPAAAAARQGPARRGRQDRRPDRAAEDRAAEADRRRMEDLAKRWRDRAAFDPREDLRRMA